MDIIPVLISTCISKISCNCLIYRSRNNFYDFNCSTFLTTDVKSLRSMPNIAIRNNQRRTIFYKNCHQDWKYLIRKDNFIREIHIWIFYLLELTQKIAAWRRSPHWRALCKTKYTSTAIADNALSKLWPTMRSLACPSLLGPDPKKRTILKNQT